MVERSRESLVAVMAAALLIAAGVLLQFYHLKHPEFYQDVPARDGAYARAMNETGAWLAPIVDGRPQLETSPMHLWAIKIASRLRPDVKAFNVRVPGALCALLLSLLVGIWFYTHALRYGREDMAEVPPEGFALLAGLVTASSPFLITAGRSGTPAAMFTLLWLAAAFCWGESLEARRSFYAGRPWRVWVIWGYLLCGLGMLVYGPFMLLLLWVPYLLAARSYRLSRPSPIHLFGLLLALLIGTTWPGWATVAWPDRTAEIWRLWATLPFVGQTPVRMSAQTGLFVLSHLPWLLLAIVMAVRVKLRKDRSADAGLLDERAGGLAIMLLVAGPITGGLLLPLMPIVRAAGLPTPCSAGIRARRRPRAALRAARHESSSGCVRPLLRHRDRIELGQVSCSANLALRGSSGRSARGAHDVIYSQWQTTARLTTIALLILICQRSRVPGRLGPREHLFHSTTGYFSRVRERFTPWRRRRRSSCGRLPGSTCITCPARIRRGRWATRPRCGSSRRARRCSSPGRERTQEMAGRRGFIPLTTNPSGEPTQPYDAMYLVWPAAAIRPRCRCGCALVGNAGTRQSAARDVGARSRAKTPHPARRRLHAGQQRLGPTCPTTSIFTIELRAAVPAPPGARRAVHATLGHEDQSYAWIRRITRRSTWTAAATTRSRRAGRSPWTRSARQRAADGQPAARRGAASAGSKRAGRLARPLEIVSACTRRC